MRDEDIETEWDIQYICIARQVEHVNNKRICGVGYDDMFGERKV